MSTIDGKTILIVRNPERILAFTFDAEGVCVGVQTGTTESYLGWSIEDVRLAMYSVMRYENGTEPQPNTGHSANGYPEIFTIKERG